MAAPECPGQASLLPETPAEFLPEDVPLEDLPPDAALPGPGPDPALLASVRRDGVLQPVLLIRDHGGVLRVADGRRRVRAARAAGLTAVPAWVADGDGALAGALALLVHGTRRDNPVAELEAIERLLAAGADERLIARDTGLAVPTIRQRLRLRQLDAALRGALRTGRLAVGVAEQAAKLPAPAQVRLAAKLAGGGKLTAADVAAERRTRLEEAAASLPFTVLVGGDAGPEEDGPAPAPASRAGPALTLLLEAALRRACGEQVRDVVALGSATLLVQCADGACTVRVSAGVPSAAELTSYMPPPAWPRQ